MRSKDSILSELQHIEGDLRNISRKAIIYPVLLARQKALYFMLEPKDKIKWYAHQMRVINEAPDKKLIAFGCGGGKTRTVLRLCKDQGGTVLVVAPKTPVLDKTWEREAAVTGIDIPMTVISKEAFKKHCAEGTCPKADILVLDEAHFAMGVTPATRQRNKVQIPKASQIHEAVIEWIQVNKPKAIYLATATPLPTPMALYAIAQIFGHKWDYFKFRNRFYAYVPVIGRGVWLPKKDAESEALLMKHAKRFGVFGRLEDFFDVPAQTHKVVHVGQTPEMDKWLKELPLICPEPLPRVSMRHQLEQGFMDGVELDENKTSEILQLADEFPKLLVFARYTAQIDMLKRKLEKDGHAVLVLDGRTKDRRALLFEAELPSWSGVVICQSQMGSAFELPSFRCTVFASMSYSYVDYQQSLGRTLRANALNKNLYIYLTAGKVDQEVLKCVREKRDFSEELFSTAYQEQL